jgi:hypothetical protein
VTIDQDDSDQSWADEKFHQGDGSKWYGISVLKEYIPRTSDDKIKERTLIGPHIRELINDEQFNDQLNEKEKVYGNHSKLLLETSWKIIRQKTTVK